MGSRVVPIGMVPTVTIFASGRIGTPYNLSVAVNWASDRGPSPLKGQTLRLSISHSADGIANKDFALACKIEEVVLWRPPESDIR